MRPLRLVAPAVLTIALLGACGSSGSKSTSSSGTTAAPTATTAAVAAAGVKTADTRLGTVLVDSQGRTLYHRTDETATHIVCTGQCASTWPPLFANGNATPAAASGVPSLTVVMRPDGKDQVAADGQPLYTFSGDAKAGDLNGEGVAGIWHVIKASAASSGSPAPAPAATTPTTAASSSSGYGY